MPSTGTVDLDVAPGHRITGGDGVYSCSCGEIHDVDTDVAQAHVEDVTP